MTKTLDKDDVAALIIAAKKDKAMTWEGIAEAIDMSPVWTHAACVGMNAMPAPIAAKLVAALDLPADCGPVLEECPTKVFAQTVPTDPCIYRLYEVVGVYGPTIKALIHEKFGDGIMSAIDFDMSVERVEDPKGDRVKIEMTGKYLQFKAW